MGKKRRYSSEADPTRERILAAALECISSVSAGRLTVRTIAATAGVNLATVHYYFGKKDLVIAEALKRFFAPVVTRLTELDSGTGNASDRLIDFLTFYLDQFHRNPGIFASLVEAMLASHLRKEPPADQAHERVLREVIGNGRERISRLVQEISGISDRTIVAMRTIQVMASVVHPLLISTLPMQHFGIDFRVAENRRRYVVQVVESIARR